MCGSDFEKKKERKRNCTHVSFKWLFLRLVLRLLLLQIPSEKCTTTTTTTASTTAASTTTAATTATAATLETRTATATTAAAATTTTTAAKAFFLGRLKTQTLDPPVSAENEAQNFQHLLQIDLITSTQR